MNYQIELKDIEPIHVAYMKYVGVVTEANKVFPHAVSYTHLDVYKRQPLCNSK